MLQPDEKLVHFVRHAQGFHNIAKDEVEFMSIALEDALLTPEGVNQCANLHKKTKLVMDNVEVLFISPFRRTLQTAIYSFPQLIHKIPWIALEMIRESTGDRRYSDKRKPLTETKGNYSNFVNFDLIENEEDPLFDLYPDAPEPESHVVARGQQFLTFLQNRKEKEILVVSHIGFIWQFLSKVVKKKSKRIDVKVRGFNNAEMRSFVLSFPHQHSEEEL